VALKEAGHDLELVGDYEEVMGHAGALVHHPDGLIEGAADPEAMDRLQASSGPLLLSVAI
jgi:hypothetical protein